jgi:hypothetical protein
MKEQSLNSLSANMLELIALIGCYKDTEDSELKIALVNELMDTLDRASVNIQLYKIALEANGDVE